MLVMPWGRAQGSSAWFDKEQADKIPLAMVLFQNTWGCIAAAEPCLLQKPVLENSPSSRNAVKSLKEKYHC